MEDYSHDTSKSNLSLFYFFKLINLLSQISKKDVDKHLPDTTAFPHCELMAKWMKGDQQLKSLVHMVKIEGTIIEHTFFTINIDPDPPYPGLGSV